MARELIVRRGTTAEHSTFTGKEGEITVDMDKDTIVVHDGATAGGHPLAKASEILTGMVDVTTIGATEYIHINAKQNGSSINAIELNPIVGSSGDTMMLLSIWNGVSWALIRVSIGDPNSGGTGKRALTVPNTW